MISLIHVHCLTGTKAGLHPNGDIHRQLWTRGTTHRALLNNQYAKVHSWSTQNPHSQYFTFIIPSHTQLEQISHLVLD